MQLEQKWKVISGIFLLNIVIVPILFFGALLFSDSINLEDFKHLYGTYFAPVASFCQFINFVKNEILETAIREEIIFRGPVWLLAVLCLGQKLGFNERDSKIFDFLYLCGVLVPLDIIWGLKHPLFLPVFWTGLTWGLAVIATKQLWPAVVLHVVSNFFLYLIIKMLSVLKVFT